MVQYSLTVSNQSHDRRTIAVYQTQPDLQVPNVFSLAWFVKYTFPGSQVVFTWTVDYNFVWAPGKLQPGVVFTASQILDAELDGLNTIVLRYGADDDDVKRTWSRKELRREIEAVIEGQAAHDFFIFEPPTASGGKTSLYMNADASVPDPRKNPDKVASFGIGMSGHGTFVCQAEANMKTEYSPHTKYWVVFGNFVQGQVLNTQQIYGNSKEIRFESGEFSQTATLNNRNEWV